MKNTIEINKLFPYDIETVWNALSNADALSEWLMPTDFVLEKNRTFTFRTKPQPGFDGIVRCEIVDFTIPSFLQYTWQGGPLKKPTLVTFRLVAVPEGTMLYFSHSGFEGLINRYIVRYILGKGWESLLTKKINKYFQV
ncbi:MAG: SRPBCC domain-containing protein [Bacteroidia bacterium]|jgi:uncharacterized protein YndB with AHSA1/START domain|nr:SRPBCC domain-containing protein [Bacteroidia bacterium]